MSLSMSFNIPYVGPINKIDTFVFGPNIWHHKERIEAKRFYAKMLVNDAKGKIIDTKNKLFFKYNIDDKEYREMPFEKALYKKDSTKTKNGSKKKRPGWSFALGGEESSIDSVFRTKQDGGRLLGLECIKWTTNIVDSTGRILIIEEWEIPEFPLLRLADSLNRSLQASLGTPDANIIAFGGGFSDMIVKAAQMQQPPPQIIGEIVKATIQSFEQNEPDPSFTMKLEITKLVAEALNKESFIVPKQYKKINN